MEQHQMRPVNSTGTPDDRSGFVVLPVKQAIMGPKRVTRDERTDGAKRFGPLPGEVFQDEAKFGSFN